MAFLEIFLLSAFQIANYWRKIITLKEKIYLIKISNSFCRQQVPGIIIWCLYNKNIEKNDPIFCNILTRNMTKLQDPDFL